MMYGADSLSYFLGRKRRERQNLMCIYVDMA